MSKRGLAVFCFVAVVACPPSFAAEGLLRPVDLRCEYRKNPLGIDALRPRLSWMVESRRPSARGEMQAAYQILTASSSEKLRRNQGDLWNSGKVTSGRSIQIPYDGGALGSGQQAWWKVRVWSGDGRPSPWSEPSIWSMGLLKAADWRGKWIGLDGGEGKAEQFRKASWIWSPDKGPGTRYFRRTLAKSTMPAWNLRAGAGPASTTVAGRMPVWLNLPREPCPPK